MNSSNAATSVFSAAWRVERISFLYLTLYLVIMNRNTDFAKEVMIRKRGFLYLLENLLDVQKDYPTDRTTAQYALLYTLSLIKCLCGRAVYSRGRALPHGEAVGAQGV